MSRISFALLIFYAFTGCNQQPDIPKELFTKIPPEHTGITFVNNLNETKDFNLFTWKYIYNGGGVAIGDVNNDGLPDIYFSGNANANKLYLNKGNLQFDDISVSSGTSASQGYKTGVSMVDINGDGWLDIYVCRDAHPNPDLRNNLVFINNKDLTFTEMGQQLGLKDEGYSTQSIFFDMDGDDDLDLFLINHGANFDQALQLRVSKTESGELKRTTTPLRRAESYQLYLNEDGVYSEITEASGVAYQGFGLSGLSADFNEDGLPDIFVANDFIEPDVIFLNNGDQTFRLAEKELFRHISENSMGSDLGDVNNDGKLDLIVLDMLAPTNERQKIFATTMSQNRYQRLDQSGYGRQLMRNVLQLNTGLQSYSEVGALAGIEKTDWSWSPLLADYNQDGFQDLFISNGIKRDMSNKDFIDFNSDSIQRARKQGVDVFNRETVLDWIDLIPSTPWPNCLFINNGDLTFSDVAATEGMSEPTFSQGAAYGDLDNDGDLDLVINNMDQPASVYRNNVSNKNFLKIKLNGPDPNTFGIGSKVIVNHEKWQQSAIMQSSRGYLSSSELMLHFGLDSLQEINNILIIWPNGNLQRLNDISANQTLVIDYHPGSSMNQGEHALLFNEAPVTHVIHQENDFNDFKNEPLLFKPQSRLGPGLAKGDVNGDGFYDLFVGGGAGQAGSLLIQRTDESFLRKEFTEDQAFEDIGASFFDFDNDGDQDLYVVSGGAAFSPGSEKYQDRLYINDGQGNFAKAKLPVETISGSVVKPFDFDKDGDQDLFIGGRVVPGNYPEAPQSMLLINESGQFSSSGLIGKVGLVADAEWNDYDGDGWEDLILVGEWMPITVLRNIEGKSFENVTSTLGLEKTSGIWSSVEVIDLTADGNVEILVGNYGLNNIFEVSSKEPLTAYQADFDNNGREETIITYYLNGEEWPLPRKEMITSVIPSLKKKFLDNQSYATAKLEDMFGSQTIQKAKKYEVFELRSGYYSLKNGQFDFTPLPMVAQSFPIYDFELLDIDNDGIKDLILGGNMSYAEVEQGPYDAGGIMILFANDNGPTFTSEKYTLLDQRGDIRDLTTHIKTTGELHLWAAQNNGPLLQYRRK